VSAFDGLLHSPQLVSCIYITSGIEAGAPGLCERHRCEPRLRVGVRIRRVAAFISPRNVLLQDLLAAPFHPSLILALSSPLLPFSLTLPLSPPPLSFAGSFVRSFARSYSVRHYILL
jgi:hypothetical protein